MLLYCLEEEKQSSLDSAIAGSSNPAIKKLRAAATKLRNYD